MIHTDLNKSILLWVLHLPGVWIPLRGPHWVLVEVQATAASVAHVVGVGQGADGYVVIQRAVEMGTQTKHVVRVVSGWGNRKKMG